MSWQQLVIQADKPDVERLEAVLLSLGAAAVTLTDAADEALFEPPPGETPLWGRTELRVLFGEEIDVTVVTQQALDMLGLPADFPYRTTLLPEKIWEREWLRDFQPMRFGRRLWVCPDREPSNAPDAIELFLDPGLAFGTGTHPTTAMCLEWLDASRLGGSEVLDYGCGSGILAIAAILLGAAGATATDIDPQALRAARRNATANNAAGQLRVFAVEDLPERTWDIVIANILAGTLADLAGRLAARTRAGGQLAISGILAEQAGEVLPFYSQWFDMAEPLQRDGWSLLAGRRR